MYEYSYYNWNSRKIHGSHTIIGIHVKHIILNAITYDQQST